MLERFIFTLDWLNKGHNGRVGSLHTTLKGNTHHSYFYRCERVNATSIPGMFDQNIAPILLKN